MAKGWGQYQPALQLQRHPLFDGGLWPTDGLNKRRKVMSLSKYKVERDNPESLLVEKEGLEPEIALSLVLPGVERVYRRPVDLEGGERFMRNRLRYLPEVEVMDCFWRDVIKVSNRIKRAETRQRQIRRWSGQN